MSAYHPHLKHAWFPLITDIHNIDPARSNGWDNQPVPNCRRITVAGGASVPAHVVKLIVSVGHVESVDHL